MEWSENEVQWSKNESEWIEIDCISGWRGWRAGWIEMDRDRVNRWKMSWNKRKADTVNGKKVD